MMVPRSKRIDVLSIVLFCAILSACQTTIPLDADTAKKSEVKEDLCDLVMIDLSPLNECRFPSNIPEDPAKAIMTIWTSLEICVEVSSMVKKSYMEEIAK